MSDQTPAAPAHASPAPAPATAPPAAPGTGETPAAVEDLLPGLGALYEDLHRNPELSFAEHRTAALLAGRLRSLGYAVTEGVGRTGVVGILRNGAGPTVLLRADIDALPVAEATGLRYASTITQVGVDGVESPVMHACGHDMHATWLIGAAAILAGQRADWSGTLQLVFQPAEELGAGAAAMIDDGFFDRFGTPDITLGQHVTPWPAGELLYRAGSVMTAADSIRIVLHGTGSHGSTPEQSVDPVVLAASVVLRLQTIVSREIAAADFGVLTIGTLHAGTKQNIIPDSAELGISMRTYEPLVRERMLAAITRIVTGECEAAGSPRPPEIEVTFSVPALVNEPAVTAEFAALFTERFGAGRVGVGPQAAPSEDFGLWGTRAGCPSFFWFTGGGDPAAFRAAIAAGRMQDVHFNHSPFYAPVQDPTIQTGVEAMVAAARHALAR
ncbi:amidohydrolase [Cryobacterium sp. MDB1-18-2]|uniref:amidohydrolase n=1 Tax=unclassified Cryobacterium TaxID=2649013 RepID=UPI00106C6F16|nr:MULTISPECIES: amidohydrolase [unclassified Cryobacterium]TFC25796.1 amidohydrolase [Cryobacterium sp. MDB1-18-2]TFC45978.1 amidohydrolase [Cryobacterium sp. MDB1-18-1]